VLTAYDFHLPANGITKLIEINTNAGGGLLSAGEKTSVEEKYIGMFKQEWKIQRARQTGKSGNQLSNIFIVDETPRQQFFYQEFELFADLFNRFGFNAIIIDVQQLSYSNGKLRYANCVGDLVYNRLTDFDLSHHPTLLRAWQEDSVVLTPHPRAHALYADKRNLQVLGDQKLLLSWGISIQDCKLLSQHLPESENVNPAQEQYFWERRKKLFFKPHSGYGSKAVYQGDRVTKRVFTEILNGNYIAQELVPPGLLPIELAGNEKKSFKFDLRLYAYQGKMLFLCARLWRGQTVNFRVPGSGFAKVEIV